MTEFTSAQQPTIHELFTQLNNNDIQYVIPRGYRDLPERVPGGDIDFLVAPGEFEKTAAIVENLGFTKARRDRIGRIADAIKKASQNPGRAVELAISSPTIAVAYSTGSENARNVQSLRGNYSEKRRYKDDVMIHFFNHLAYLSPTNNVKVRVDPEVEQAMLERRRFQGPFAIPSPPDELTHLLCRGVFDKHGEFPEYYIEACEQLWSEIQSNDTYQQELEILLEKVFFDADTVVYDTIHQGTYNSLREQLRSYADY